MNADGTIVAVGAHYHDGAPGINSGQARVFQWTDGSWTQLGATIDGEGASDHAGGGVALSADGTVLALGGSHNDANGATDSGHVRIFHWADGAWSKVATVEGEAANDWFGYSVALSADGGRLAAGARFNDDSGADAGAAYVFELDGRVGGKTSPDLAEISVWIDGTEYPADGGTTTAAGMTGTFVTNVGVRHPGQTPFQVDADTFVFGVHDGGYFKMASVNAAGQLIGNRALLTDYMTIDELTLAQWEQVQYHPNNYDVQDIVIKVSPADDLEAIEWTPNAEARRASSRAARPTLPTPTATAGRCATPCYDGHAAARPGVGHAVASARGDVIAVGAGELGWRRRRRRAGAGASHHRRPRATRRRLKDTTTGRISRATGTTRSMWRRTEPSLSALRMR